MYTVQDSFDIASKINQQNSDEYRFVLLDVVFVFTNVPLKKTVDIVLKYIYTDKEITTTLTKRSSKKLILKAVKKQLFILIVKCMNKQIVLVWEDPWD